MYARIKNFFRRAARKIARFTFPAKPERLSEAQIRAKILNLKRNMEDAWGESYRAVAALIKEHGLRTGIEIGSAFGGNAESMLSRTDISSLTCIDPYEHTPGYDDAMNLPQNEFDVLFRMTSDRLKRYGQCRLLRQYSFDAIKEISGQVDFVYIDADHSYEGVMRDLGDWFFKVRTGGIMMGHDYGHGQFEGVKRAVDQFFQRFGWEVHAAPGTVWWVRKQDVPISFIIPAYNCARTIEESVESIMKTNFTNGDELVIADDGSTDATPDILARIAEKYPGSKIVRNRYNLGGGPCRNSAVSSASHELIFCLDSDNVLPERCIPALKECLVRSGCDIASFEKILYFKERVENRTHVRTYLKNRYGFKDFFKTDKIPASSGNLMFTKHSWILAHGYPDAALDTWGFGLRQAAVGCETVILKDYENSFYYHRIGIDSYYVREARKGTPGISALQLIIPYLDALYPADVKYLLSEKHRFHWLETLDARPLRLKGERSIMLHPFAIRVRRKLSRFMHI